MNMVAEYLERALEFEHLAAAERDPQLRANLENQAAEYRKIAVRRAKEAVLSEPKKPN